jgi:inhibitor of cysteine peptidase
MTAPRRFGGDAANARGVIKFTGKVVYNNLEGGFFGIVADDGKAYDPTNLPAEFRKAGMRVSAVIKKRPDMMSFHQWGTIVEIIDIKPAR